MTTTANRRAIYMDYQATTPMDPRVLAVMLPYFTENYGNAASRNHPFGWKAEEAVEKAREQVAALIGASPKEIVFTSGATESDNLAIKGAAHFNKEKGNHIITTTIEHKAVLDTCKHLEQEGFEVTYLPVNKEGLISVAAVEAAMRPTTVLVSVMHANNEIGTIQPLAEIGKLCKAKGVLFHTDATQGVGKLEFDVEAMGVDLASFTAHKIYAPKGVGALYVRRKSPRVRIEPEIHGGGHERGFRSGTLNVPGIAGFGEACRIAKEEWRKDYEHAKRLRERLLAKLRAELDELFINGSPEHGMPYNLNISFAYVEGESLLMGINDEIAVSSGSACTSASLEPSYVLRALGVGEDLAHTSIRFGIGRFTTDADVDYTAEKVIAVVKRLREMSPLYEMAKEGIDISKVKWGGH
jgi:cysteine desulfurase